MKTDEPLHESPDVAPAFLFDLDGTLIDSVYQHVLAWREALDGPEPSSPSGEFTAGLA